ncbi:MAG: rod shape-determining protein MreD [Gammaproteobacteria bacterium]
MSKFFTILLSLIFSVILTISTFPLGSFSPDWTQLFLIYWILAAPLSIGLLSSWMVGLVLDVVLGSTLGINALMYTLISYLVFKIYHIARYITVFQQSIVIMAIMLIKITFVLWIDSILSVNNYNISLYWSCLTSALCWPLVFYSLRVIRRKYNISE